MKQLTIEQLIKRMKKAGGDKACGVNFLDGDKIELWWQMSLTQKYILVFSHYQLSVESKEFQRAMHQAEIDLNQ